ncbi:MAG TPA: hypothetical protein VGK59_03555, partial [Ohtaekwangia sp.]
MKAINIECIFIVSAVMLVSEFTGCQTRLENCVRTESEELKAYSEAVNEIVKRQLGDSYRDKDRDSNAKNCVLFMDTVMRPQFSAWSRYQRNPEKSFDEIKEVISSFPQKEDEVIGLLNSIQKEYAAAEFEVCHFNFVSISDNGTASDCIIGKIALSNLVFDSEENRALIYYYFNYGELCGKGELLVLDRRGNSWVIQNAY